LRRAVSQTVTDFSEVSIALLFEAVRTSETPVNFHVASRRNIPEGCHFHTRRRDNLKSHAD
jgi:hypothetical protein